MKKLLLLLVPLLFLVGCQQSSGGDLSALESRLTALEDTNRALELTVDSLKTENDLLSDQYLKLLTLNAGLTEKTKVTPTPTPTPVITISNSSSRGWRLDIPKSDTVKNVTVICIAAASKERVIGKRALAMCMPPQTTIELIVETEAGQLYEVEIPASDLQEPTQLTVGTIPNLPKIGDTWPPSD